MRILTVLLWCAASLAGATLKAGLARVDITPKGSVWMSGYAARTHASDGVLNRLWAKALAIESSPGGRIVIVSTDLVGIPRDLSDEVAAKLKKQYGLNRSQFLINASHTHTRVAQSPKSGGVAGRGTGEIDRLPERVGQCTRVGRRVRAQGPVARDNGVWGRRRRIRHQSTGC